MKTVLVLVAFIGLVHAGTSDGGQHVAMQLFTENDVIKQCKADLAGAQETLAETEQALAEANKLLGQMNLALNQPAFVKQHYHNNALAGLAVDGNSDPDRFKTFSCAVCGRVDQAWWAVDLGTPTRVGIVRLMARLNPVWADQLANFQIGVSDVSPEEQEPTLDNYTVCATQEKPLPSGKFTDFQCGKEGRYLIVQRKDSHYLTICEAEVYRG